MTQTRHRRGKAITRIADRIDLAIDMLTLGQYGLEQAPDGAAGSDRSAPAPWADWDWEVPASARRRGCERRTRRATVPAPVSRA